MNGVGMTMAHDGGGLVLSMYIIHIYIIIYNCICIYTNICILHIHVDMQIRIKTRVPWTQTVGKRIFIPQTYGKIGFDQSPHVLSCATDAGISQPASCTQGGEGMLRAFRG